MESVVKVGKCKKCTEDIFAFDGAVSNTANLLCEKCISDEPENEQKKAILQKVEEYFKRLDTDRGVKKRFAIPERYTNSTMSNFVGDLKGKDEEWLGNSKENLLIQSPKAGNGKTHLSIAMMVEWVKSKREIIEQRSLASLENSFSSTLVTPTANFVNFASLMLEVKSSFDSKETSEQKVIKKYCNYDILVIDDIGTEKYSEYVQAVIYTILNTRYENMKPTIITTNLSSADMNASYGSRILSRVASGVVITLEGRDMRLSGAKASITHD